MAEPLLPGDLWAVIQPVLPPWQPSPKGGQPRLDDRKALPGELGRGSGMTRWRRRRDWQADGTWATTHAALLARLHAAGQIDWPRAAVDSSSVRAVVGGRRPAGPRPTAAGRGPSTTCW